MALPAFRIEFQTEGQHYWVDVQYSALLPDRDKMLYRIKEHSFLAHLFSGKNFMTFEMFIDEDAMNWVAEPEGLIDPRIVELIGEKIDERFE